jgi:hypothetical protein
VKPNHRSTEDRTNPHWFWRSSGLVTTGQGIAAGDDGPIEIMVMAFLGAFLGLVLGLMAANLSRFLSRFGNRQVGETVWGAYGAAAGALLFAVLALAT